MRLVALQVQGDPSHSKRRSLGMKKIEPIYWHTHLLWKWGEGCNSKRGGYPVMQS